MDRPAQLAAPLILTERIKTKLGSLRVVLSNYPASGLLSVELLLDKDLAHTSRSAPVASLSFEPTQPVSLQHGEFAAKSVHELMMKTFLDSGLFKPTGRMVADGEIWRLAGTAMLEYNSAFAPSKAASRASFPAHLFGRRHFDTLSKQMLAAEFDKLGYTMHSPAGESVWVVREYCERNRIPFVIHLVNEKDSVVGARVCKAELAKTIEAQNAAEGYSLVTVYESPRQPWQLTEFHTTHH